MTEKEELIKHAAVKTACGMIIMGKHHAECFRKMSAIGLSASKNREDQGFMTNKGRYVNRKEGAIIAYNSNQINKETDILFSEHLWSKIYNSKHKYDEVTGYNLMGHIF